MRLLLLYLVCFEQANVRVCMLSHFSSVRLLATLWAAAGQAPLSMDFQARVLEWVEVLKSRELTDGLMVSTWHLLCQGLGFVPGERNKILKPSYEAKKKKVKSLNN